jgi:divalent metal cation (Fe/Co/Zn/Cd) transporter
VREIHNLSVLRTDDGAQVSLHLKLPADLSLEDAHAVATEVERSISESLPEVASVQTHLEPLAEPERATSVDRDAGFVEQIVRDATGAPPRELRLLETDDGLVAFLTLGVDPDTTLAEAHRRASDVEGRIRRERPEIADVIVHTEP